MNKWEILAHGFSTKVDPPEGATYRLSVESGWIYRYGEALCFVPSLSVPIPKKENIIHAIPRTEKCEIIDVEAEYIDSVLVPRKETAS